MYLLKIIYYKYFLKLYCVSNQLEFNYTHINLLNKYYVRFSAV